MRTLFLQNTYTYDDYGNYVKLSANKTYHIEKISIRNIYGMEYVLDEDNMEDKSILRGTIIHTTDLQTYINNCTSDTITLDSLILNEDLTIPEGKNIIISHTLELHNGAKLIVKGSVKSNYITVYEDSQVILGETGDVRVEEYLRIENCSNYEDLLSAIKGASKNNSSASVWNYESEDSIDLNYRWSGSRWFSGENYRPDIQDMIELNKANNYSWQAKEDEGRESWFVVNAESGNYKIISDLYVDGFDAYVMDKNDPDAGPLESLGFANTISVAPGERILLRNDESDGVKSIRLVKVDNILSADTLFGELNVSAAKLSQTTNRDRGFITQTTEIPVAADGIIAKYYSTHQKNDDDVLGELNFYTSASWHEFNFESSMEYDASKGALVFERTLPLYLREATETEFYPYELRLWMNDYPYVLHFAERENPTNQSSIAGHSYYGDSSNLKHIIQTEGPKEIHFGEKVLAYNGESWDNNTYTFIPEKSGKYALENTPSGDDPQFHYDAFKLSYNDEWEEWDYEYVDDFEAGETYYFEIFGCQNVDSFKVVENNIDISNVRLENLNISGNYLTGEIRADVTGGKVTARDLRNSSYDSYEDYFEPDWWEGEGRWAHIEEKADGVWSFSVLLSQYGKQKLYSVSFEDQYGIYHEIQFTDAPIYENVGTFQDALDEAKEGQTFYLRDYYYLSQNITIPKGITVKARYLSIGSRWNDEEETEIPSTLTVNGSLDAEELSVKGGYLVNNGNVTVDRFYCNETLKGSATVKVRDFVLVGINLLKDPWQEQIIGASTEPGSATCTQVVGWGETADFIWNGSSWIPKEEYDPNQATKVEYTLTASDKVYDGKTTANVTAQITDANVAKAMEADGVEIKVSNAQFAQSDVGNAIAITADVTLVGDNASSYELVDKTTDLTASITPADMSADVKIEGTTGEEGQPYTVNVVKLPEDASITYCTSEDGSYVPTAPNYASVGTYTVYYKVTKANYADVTGNVDIIVTEKNSVKVAYTLTASDKVYDGTVDAKVTPNITDSNVKAAMDADDVSIEVSNAKFAKSDVGNNITVTADVKLVGSKAAAYELVAPTETLSANITPADMSDDVEIEGTEGVEGKSNTVKVVKLPEGASITYCTTEDGDYVEEAPRYSKAGQYKVYYKVTKSNYNDVAGSVEIIVKKVTTITVGSKVSVFIDETKTLSAEVTDDMAITYTSSDESVVKVDASGELTPVSKGTAIITLTTEEDNSHKAAEKTVDVVVEKHLSNISCSAKIWNLASDGEDNILNIANTVASSVSGKIHYESGSPGIATIDENGVITGISEGTSIISIYREETDIYEESNLIAIPVNVYEPQAEYNGKKYVSVSSALSRVPADEATATITLLKNTTPTEILHLPSDTALIPAGKTITLNLAGYAYNGRLKVEGRLILQDIPVRVARMLRLVTMLSVSDNDIKGTFVLDGGSIIIEETASNDDVKIIGSIAKLEDEAEESVTYYSDIMEAIEDANEKAEEAGEEQTVTVTLTDTATLSSNNDEVELKENVTLNLAGNTLSSDGNTVLTGNGTIESKNEEGNDIPAQLSEEILGEESSNITVAEVIETIQIPTYDITVEDKEYDGQIPDIKVTEKKDQNYDGYTWEVMEDDAEVSVGTHSYTVGIYKKEGSDKTLVQRQSVEATILPRTISYELSAEDKDYDGNRDAIVTLTLLADAELKALLKEEEIDVTVTDKYFKTSDPGINKVVTCVVSLTGEGTENYKLDCKTKVLTATINAPEGDPEPPEEKAPVEVAYRLTAADKVYDGSKIADVTVTVADKEIAEQMATDGVTLEVSNAQFAQAGAGENITVTADVTLTGAKADNYVLADGPVNVAKANITPADMSAGVQVEGTSGVEGQSYTVNVVKLPEGAKITYSTSEHGEYMAEAPSYSTPGTYKVYYKVSKENYQDVTGSVNIVVSYKNVTKVKYTLTASNKVYDGTDKAFVVVNIKDKNVKKALNKDGVTIEVVSASFDQANVGTGIKVTADVKLVGENAEKYELIAPITVLRANITAASMAADVQIEGTNGVAGQSNTVKVVKLPEGATITYSTSAKGSYVATAPSYSVAGNYKVYYKVSKDNYQDVTGNVSIVVSKDAPVSPNPVRNITINAISDKIDAGKKLTLTASVFPENATNKKLMWTTSDRKVATVNSDGIVTANKKASGKSAIITATAADGSGVKADYVITVK